ncbi:MAG: Glucosamine-6-phosphate deaminase [candidate division WS2 bacterium]|uniref:Glucosamine-6-phosphate deaminase n=1 Tax=Psychracetigena formicireducens TaxID=2986056 RepID=A0A9E2BJY1_PSYF1|nr:Glucosamine-6-phosphate deaminase [Candidatus Psychracetigena formicireducens]MBT9145870.1 Glucosamine-6-phosphate deaminase [Candidatus Psychracetigena formicireducens]
MRSKEFKFAISDWIPYTDAEACERARNIKRQDIEKTQKGSHPDFKIKVLDDNEFSNHRLFKWLKMIMDASNENRNIVFIWPQPHIFYRKLAHALNTLKIDCRKLYIFSMDEYADEDGNTPSPDYPQSLYRSLLYNFYYRLDKDIRPPIDHMQGPTKKNINDYGKMIEDVGGADLIECGVGWDCHIAMVYGSSKKYCSEFYAETIEEWQTLGPRIVKISPLCIPQTVLDPDYGASGDWSLCPPKGATVGPAQFVNAKNIENWNMFSIAGTNVSWQRFSVRLGLHGPIDPIMCPATLFQMLPTKSYLTENIAADIKHEFDNTWWK